MGDKGVHTFSKVISPKVNLKAQLEFELGNYSVLVHHVNRYTIGTSLRGVWQK